MTRARDFLRDEIRLRFSQRPLSNLA